MSDFDICSDAWAFRRVDSQFKISMAIMYVV